MSQAQERRLALIVPQPRQKAARSIVSILQRPWIRLCFQDRKTAKYEGNYLSQSDVRNVAKDARYLARFRLRRLDPRISQGPAVERRTQATLCPCRHQSARRTSFQGT